MYLHLFFQGIVGATVVVYYIKPLSAGSACQMGASLSPDCYVFNPAP